MCCVIAEGLIWQDKTFTETMRVFLVAMETALEEKQFSISDSQLSIRFTSATGLAGKFHHLVKAF